MFKLPEYIPPDFSAEPFISAPNAQLIAAPSDGVVPDNFYATSIYPEYIKIKDEWVLIQESRMDCVVVLRDNKPQAVEFRNVKKGELTVVGRKDNGEMGIYLHPDAFNRSAVSSTAGIFAFRTSNSRETAFSSDYDRLYKLLEYEKEHGYIIWVLGPAVSFDYDSRNAMSSLIAGGYVHALFAGNALATHDLEATFFHTALGQDIYSKQSLVDGHYHHIETINRARACGSIEKMIEDYNIRDGIVQSCVKHSVPMVLAGSIRDDGPLPGVYSNVYDAQDAMRAHTQKATTVICLATQLHTIATGNMTSSYQVVDGEIRPVYFYTVDISEFVVNKLKDRGSLSSESFITNIQDFVVHIEKHLMGASQ